MAGKEATVYIVDVGLSMGERNSGRQETNLDFALEYVWDKITTTVATGRKTAMAGVIALRTDSTDNELQQDNSYSHISMLQDISQIQMAELRKLRSELTVSQTASGDAVSAIVIAIQMIVRQCKKLKYTRRIVLVTDAKMHMQTADLGQITAKLKEDEIELVVLGVDFDDAEYGFKEEGKSPEKASNEVILKQLCDDCNGVYGTLAQAVDELQTPRVKQVKPTHSYKGTLTLGDIYNYDTAITINIERYPKTMTAPAPSASSFVVRNDLEATQSQVLPDAGDETDAANNGLESVRAARTYQVDDENAPGGKRDIARDELAKGYEYGRTAVHISDSDRNITTYETKPGFEIIGFVDANQYNRFTDMGRTNVIIAERTNDKAYMALSSFIHALYELESYAVARLVVKENKDPRVVLLQPAIEPEFECLYDVELPFKEDVRSYKFPPLDRVVTVSGKELHVHRNLPSDELKDAISDYVDSMDLSEFGKDDEGQPTEYAPLDETFSPKLHRINQVIKHRAIYPDKDPPDTREILLRYSNPPQELADKAKPIIERVLAAADLKQVPPKAQGKRFRGQPTPKPVNSDLNLDELISSGLIPERNQERINPNNSVPEFVAMFRKAYGNDDDVAPDLDGINSAFDQMKKIVLDRIKSSFANVNYQRALEEMGRMREECVECDMPELYNDFCRELKAKAVGGELDGDRLEFMREVRVKRLGLMVESKGHHGGVTQDEANEWAKMTSA